MSYCSAGIYEDKSLQIFLFCYDHFHLLNANELQLKKNVGMLIDLNRFAFYIFIIIKNHEFGNTWLLVDCELIFNDSYYSQKLQVQMKYNKIYYTFLFLFKEYIMFV